MARYFRDEIDQVYAVDQARELDRLAIEELGLPGIQLMKRAGRAAFTLLRDLWPDSRALEVFCGSGNNGGDGYIVAGLAAAQGLAVQVWEIAATERISGDAGSAREFARQSGARLSPFAEYQQLADTDVLVDALLGIGFRGPARGAAAEAIEIINGRQLPVLALDLPSGVEADTGRIEGVAVRATATLSFILMKAGLLTGAAPDQVGELYLDDLDLPAELLARVQPRAHLLGAQVLTEICLPRQRTAHKGRFGTLLVLGGDRGMGGAALLAAEAALSTGAGRVLLATRPEHVSAALSRCPEVMVQGVDRATQIEPLLDQATAIVVGPGLGQGAWGQQLLYFALRRELPRVFDADALNILAQRPEWQKRINSECILTPHPGEAARLLKQDVATIQADRFAALEALERWGAAVVLKGVGTLVSEGMGAPGLCSCGNPGMATAGMGDVLSGILGALLARGIAIGAAARAGVVLHALAGDCEAAARGETGLRAADLLPWIRDLQANGVSHG